MKQVSFVILFGPTRSRESGASEASGDLLGSLSQLTADREDPNKITNATWRTSAGILLSPKVSRTLLGHFLHQEETVFSLDTCLPFFRMDPSPNR